MTYYKIFFQLSCIIVWITLVSSSPLRIRDPKINTYNFTLTRVNLAPDGFTRSLATVNGQFPGPVIEINKGERIVMNVQNELGEPSAIHSHGMFQRGTPWYDGVPGQSQCEIPNNFTFTYDFTVNDQAGTYWYHSHSSGQYVDGIVGPLVIHDPEDPYLKDYDEEIIVVLSDYFHTQAEELLKKYNAPNGGDNPVPDNGLINGKNNYDCSKAPPGSTCVNNSGLSRFEFVANKRYRIRIINTSAFSSFIFSIDKHVLELIEADGSYTKPININRLPINVAQRYSVIVTANQSVSNYIMRSDFQKDCMPGADLPDVTAIVHYDGASEDPPVPAPWPDVVKECEDLDQGILLSLNDGGVPPSTREIDLSAILDFDKDRIIRGFINNVTYVPDIKNPSLAKIFAGQKDFPPEQNAFIFNTTGEVVDIILTTGDIEHPFHMHGHQFWVLGFGTGAVDRSKFNKVNPIKRDTATLPGWIAIRFVLDNPGVFGLHCHMEWHLQAGLLAQLIELPDEIAKMTPPKDWTDLCSLNT
jgi:FtsP/CotA-like multicopper oxidase with cupredoxin domain